MQVALCLLYVATVAVLTSQILWVENFKMLTQCQNFKKKIERKILYIFLQSSIALPVFVIFSFCFLGPQPRTLKITS
jgi:hypothetical protein